MVKEATVQDATQTSPEDVETGDAVERKSWGAILSALAPQAVNYDQWRQHHQ
jgi:hypothetical protein